MISLHVNPLWAVLIGCALEKWGKGKLGQIGALLIGAGVLVLCMDHRMTFP